MTAKTHGMALIHESASPFGMLQVAWSERTRTVTLYQGGYLQSRSDRYGIAKVDYIHAIYDLIRQGDARDVLILGCGGGTLGTMLTGLGLRVTMVDINPKAFDIAKEFFALSPKITCILDDGMAFLNRTRARFDVIVCDMYLGDEAAPYAGAPMFLQLAARRLKPLGRIFLNVIVYGDADPMADRIAQAAKFVNLNARILDGSGKIGRNAVLAIGAVEKLRRPKLTLIPDGGSANLAKALEAYGFRRPSLQRGIQRT